ncbi:MAG: hypothetical protein K2F57_05420, partial [Candidatus Gastranaerophilales bacterium]|nr:hypothetical protein [Candidatus Gastranaerophilales bacterium]
MNIAVISDGTFDEEFYKNFLEQGGNSLACIIDKNSELPEGEYDAILLDFYNEGLNVSKIRKLSDKYPEALFGILADIDDNPESEKEVGLIKKFEVEFAFCFNVKTSEPKELTDFINIMKDVKKECDEAVAPY